MKLTDRGRKQRDREAAGEAEARVGGPRQRASQCPRGVRRRPSRPPRLAARQGEPGRQDRRRGRAGDGARSGREPTGTDPARGLVVVLRPCLRCGVLTDGSYCPEHRPPSPAWTRQHPASGAGCSPPTVGAAPTAAAQTCRSESTTSTATRPTTGSATRSRCASIATTRRPSPASEGLRRKQPRPTPSALHAERADAPVIPAGAPACS